MQMVFRTIPFGLVNDIGVILDNLKDCFGLTSPGLSDDIKTTFVGLTDGLRVSLNWKWVILT